MKQLSSAAFERAAAFVNAHARPVDQRLFAYYFEGGPAGAVLDALKPYQNADGGFGHGLEPDFRTAVSSSLATTVALQFLRDVEAPEEHPLVVGAVDYLLGAYDPERRAWAGVPPEVNDAPRARWWQYQGPPAGFTANPGAEVIGYLHAYPRRVPAAFLAEVTDQALSHLETLPDAMEMHDALCYLRLAQELPAPHKAHVLEKLRRGARRIAALDPAEWAGYSARPLWLAPSPASPLADLLAAELDLNLDYEVDTQGEDGSWSPFWEWGQYPEEWSRARREWQGHLTVKTLKSLADFGRLAR